MRMFYWLPIVFCLVAGPGPAMSVETSGAKNDAAAIDEAAQRGKLEQAQTLIADGKSDAAIVLIDQVLAYYAGRYPEGKTRWYVARNVEESLFYTGMATLPNLQEAGKTDARVLIVKWADAFYLKGYALNELKRPADARHAIEQAVRLSPENAKYLIELAETYKLERNWNECYRLFQDAEAAAGFSPPEYQRADRAQAKRGQAFVFVEQGKLDQAEKILRQCLQLDRNDERAKRELEYIARLRTQAGRP